MFRKTQFIFGIILLLISPEIFSQKTLKKAELQAEAGEYQKAINSYQSYIGENPDDYFAVAKLADILALTGELDKAETLYSNIPQSAAIDVVTYKNHGDLLKKMMRYEESKSKYALIPSLHSVLLQPPLQLRKVLYEVANYRHETDNKRTY